jgi:hypothetical protein
MDTRIENAIDRISETVPKPDNAVSAEHYDAIRAYWDVIAILSETIELGVNEWEG